MNFDDYSEHFLTPEFGFSGFLALGALLATGLVQWGVKNYQRHAASYALVPAACGLTGAEAARRLLALVGISNVGVTATAFFDRYHTKVREVQLTPNHFNASSLAALAVAAHEVGHALQFAAGWWACRLRRIVVPLTWAIMASAALLLVMGLTVMPLATAGTVIIVMCLVSLVLQLAVILPIEFDATARAKTILLQSGLVAPNEQQGVDRLLQAAAMTYLTYEAQRWLYLLMAAFATWWLANRQF
jgi:Zn-dependent membrane protease YugP